MKAKKIWAYIISILVLGMGIFIYVRYSFVFGEGTKAGELNSFMLKGYIFKTYEGKLIQSGFKENVQSNEFDFSVTNPRVAQILMNNAGKEMQLHYKQYFGTLPWRGMQTDIVDSVYQINGTPGETELSPK
jgi:hypothetical protein